MADTLDSVPATSNQHDVPSIPVKSPHSPPGKSNSRPSGPRGPPLHQIYALPAPIRTFPLPSFYPSNPVSLFHLVYAWVSQFVSPPPAEPAVIHQGIWSPETRSVQIKDPKSIRALWEQGFFGKGNYSRSEPNWFKREQARKGKHTGHVAEDLTAQRRQERKLMKWDRARKEQEAIQRTRLQEAWVAPVGPKELLALPNSEQDWKLAYSNAFAGGGSLHQPIPNGESLDPAADAAELNGSMLVTDEDTTPITPQMNGHSSHPLTPTDSGKLRKTVRFSPKVESTTFQLSDPPTFRASAQPNGNGHVVDGRLANGTSPSPQPTDLGLSAPLLEESHTPEANSEPEHVIVDRELLQLCLEETFYLVFALGALTVLDPATGKPFTPSDLFTLCRQVSYVPPRKIDLQPDDPFLINYAVYHHFRSLGWVTRPGIKFGVDWMLYNRGPVFSHAEFAVIVLPAYSDPWWKAEGRQPPRRSWHWLHTINRVQSTALKTLVLAYVEIPPPSEEQLAAADVLKKYKVREFIVKRWLSNRNRD
ncbi:Alternative oxidase, mitochondrial precursor [Hypoxylon texense]